MVSLRGIRQDWLRKVSHKRKGLIIMKLSHLLPKWFWLNASWLWLLWRVGILDNLMSIMLFYMGIYLRRFICLFHQGFRARGRWFVSSTSPFMGLNRLLGNGLPNFLPFWFNWALNSPKQIIPFSLDKRVIVSWFYWSMWMMFWLHVMARGNWISSRCC